MGEALCELEFRVLNLQSIFIYYFQSFTSTAGCSVHVAWKEGLPLLLFIKLKNTEVVYLSVQYHINYQLKFQHLRLIP